MSIMVMRDARRSAVPSRGEKLRVLIDDELDREWGFVSVRGFRLT